MRYFFINVTLTATILAILLIFEFSSVTPAFCANVKADGGNEISHSSCAPDVDDVTNNGANTAYSNDVEPSGALTTDEAVLKEDIKKDEAYFETDYMSKYMWYGVPVSKGATAMSNLGFESGGWTYILTGNYDFTDRIFNQVNAYISKTGKLGRLETEYALQSYFYPHDEEMQMTTEFITTFTLPLKKFDLYLTQAWDIKTYKGAYITDLGIAFEKNPGDRRSLKSSLYLEYGSRRFNEVNLDLPEAALNSINAEFSYTYTRKDGIYFKPHCEYMVIIDRDLKELSEKKTSFNYGITVGRSF